MKLFKIGADAVYDPVRRSTLPPAAHKSLAYGVTVAYGHYNYAVTKDYEKLQLPEGRGDDGQRPPQRHPLGQARRHGGGDGPVDPEEVAVGGGPPRQAVFVTDIFI